MMRIALAAYALCAALLLTIGVFGSTPADAGYYRDGYYRGGATTTVALAAAIAAVAIRTGYRSGARLLRRPRLLRWP